MGIISLSERIESLILRRLLMYVEAISLQISSIITKAVVKKSFKSSIFYFLFFIKQIFFV